MSIFRRDTSETPPTPSQPKPREPAPPASRAVTHIAPGTTISGEISGETEVLIDGRFEGQLKMGTSVTVGRDGVVKGQVQARSVRVDGKVEGNVRGGDLVEVTASGSLEGDISAARVVIAEGAFFKGKVDMSGKGNKGPSSKPQGKPGDGASKGGREEENRNREGRGKEKGGS